MVEVDKIESVEFKWGKMRGRGGRKKDVQFYESFIYDGVEYKLYDSVYLYVESEIEPYIGKLIKVWENSDKTKKVKVLWFFRPCEISNYLGAEVASEKELFLATGEGVGLANVNSLEAIAGKCNVICTSKDSRNPQPTDDELHMADFIFFRMFDVGRCVILDDIGEQIAGVEVKFLLNRVGVKKSFGIPTCDPEKKQFSGHAVATNELVILSKEKTSEEGKTIKEDGNSISDPLKGNTDSKVSLAKEKSSLGEKLSSCAGENSAKVATTGCRKGNTTGNMTTSDSMVNENLDSEVPLVKQNYSLGDKPASTGTHLRDLVETSEQQKNIDMYTSRSKDKVDLKPSLLRQKSSLRENSASNLDGEPTEMATYNRKKYSSSERITLSAKDVSGRAESNLGKGLVSQVHAEEKIKVTRDFIEMDDRSPKRVKLDATIPTEEKMKVTRDFSEMDDRSSKRAKLDAAKSFAERDKNSVQNSNRDLNISNPTSTATASEDKSKLKLAKNPHETKNGSPTRLGEKLMKLADNGKWPEATLRPASTKGSKIESRKLEATQRPEADKSKWFKRLPWEDQMRAAHEQGTLVHLQNLDPSSTSAEVEVIIKKAFGESCTAKMIQRTAYSSPLSGQALVIFRTRELAEMVLSKLDEGCLLQSNGRPLVGRMATPCLRGKQSTFPGHLIIDKLRLQMQREMKEAVSNSHCSQPNTLEYDMAMEWCLLQARSDQAWKKLHEQQRQELRKLKATLKCK